MRISDWSSDVCSSDLIDQVCAAGPPMVIGLGSSLPGPPWFQPIGGGGSRLSMIASICGTSMVSYSSSSLRSEEHTSELQSLMRISYAVFCLKKKTLRLYIRDYTVMIMIQSNTYQLTTT